MEEVNEIEFLKNSLIYQMSLGSKELYHSNVWAWLIDKDHKFAEVFFDKELLSDYKILTVDREYQHRDIIIWLQKDGFYGEEEKYYLVIENKIKSLPTREQLEEYTVDLTHNKLLGAVFTGMVNPFNEQIRINQIKWEYVDYNTIAKKIEDYAKQSNIREIKEKLTQIVEYCNVIRAISSLIKKELSNNQSVLSYDCINELRDLRIQDLYIKLKGAEFITYVKGRKKELPEISDFHLDINQSFHNGKATLDFRYSNWVSDEKHWLVLGVQIEGKQYRLLAERDRESMECEQVYNFFENNWFNQKSRSNSMRKKYCQYSGDYSFVYQYSDITIENNAYVILFESIKQDLIRAKNIIENLQQSKEIFK